MRNGIWVFVILVGCAEGDELDAVQPSGQGETVFSSGDDPDNPFLHELGTNQRTCASCHDRAAGWSITPSLLQARFDASCGADPIFRPIDGATSPNTDVASEAARRNAYSLLLSKGLIRVGLPIPAGAEFSLSNVSDPYGFASAAELSLFRRPLPSTNLRFHAAVMWDAREPTLDQQARDATMGHAQASAIDPEEAIAQIVAFESSAYTAQRFDDVAGDLASDGASGGAQALLALELQVGINGFTLYAAWADADTSSEQGQRRASIARGERIFNTRRFRIRGVAGLADQQGTCSTCHDTPNVGSRSLATLLDIGVSDEGRDRRGREQDSALPQYTLTNIRDGRVLRTSDPGLALISGRWDDIGKFKVPALRGLAMRPPYFHNGMADDLDEVVRFYRRRFDVDLSDRDQDDLVAFLSAL